MTAKMKHDQKSSIVEFIKKDYAAWSNSSDSKISGYTLDRPVLKLKTLPQARRHEVNEVIANLKAALPDVSPKDVRRFYLPYFEAILLELKEQGFIEAYHSLVELLELDDHISDQTPAMMSWKKPYLKDQKEFVNCLKNGFVAFEKGKRNGTRYETRAKLFRW